MKRSNQRRSIRFRNGFRFNLVWSQFRTLRDSYTVLKKYAIEQLDEDAFRMRLGEKAYTGSLVTIASIGELLPKYHVEQLEDNLFRVWNDKVYLTGSDGMLYSMFEIEMGVYDLRLPGRGDHQIEIKIADVTRVLGENGADIAKIDCEGAEENLVSVPADTLRKTEFYMNEVQAPSIRKKIMKKFENSGFKLVKESMRDASMSILYFKRDRSP